MRGTTLELRPDALAHNAGRARELAGDARVFAMIKADGYGHGLALAARALAQQVDGFGVAVMDEAKVLRHLGLAHPLLVAEGFFDADELALAGRLHAEVVVHSPWQVDLLEANPSQVSVWLKVNSGMNRLGMAPGLARAQAARLQAVAGVKLLGVMTHFSCVDRMPDPFTHQQLAVVRSLPTSCGCRSARPTPRR